MEREKSLLFFLCKPFCSMTRLSLLFHGGVFKGKPHQRLKELTV
ncbi:hypothetical protein BSI_09080 [Bacillus inaquosorum KCTC 13429]|uniref:Uncharacterized protein n=1 Tax=Bacillus inaquosorum KCTC 13429 TaxID=1236548 RepID=A0A9W5LJG0_9BACI|nr:hypothetical protein BSI_09080 [Bacillus inaquosorum KCTC 13429]